MTSFKHWQLSSILTANVAPIQDAFIVPLTVLALVVLISLSYKKAKQLQLSPAKKQQLINTHALATEFCQLFLVVSLFIDTTSIIEKFVQFSLSGVISTTKAALLIEAAVVAKFAIQGLAVLAVDLIEGRILLETWRHPYQWQPFVLTRRWLSGGGKTRLQQRRGIKKNVDKRAPEQPFSNLKMDMDYRRVKLNYLDLACVNRVQQNSKLQPQHGISTFGTYSKQDRSSTSSETDNRSADLPTPPDSVQSTEGKRVKWAPTTTNYSPENEQRMSLL